jgi:hypothetical protein
MMISNQPSQASGKGVLSCFTALTLKTITMKTTGTWNLGVTVYSIEQVTTHSVCKYYQYLRSNKEVVTYKMILLIYSQHPELAISRQSSGNKLRVTQYKYKS